MSTGHGQAPVFDPCNQPSRTVVTAARSWEVQVIRPDRLEGRQRNGARRTVNEPAPTITSSADNGNFRWCYERPATTVVGSFCPDVIAAPGYRLTESRQNAEASVRVTNAEASVLQSFDAAYPWQGSRTKQFEQVGNAVPPLLAAHVLSSVTGIALATEATDAA